MRKETVIHGSSAGLGLVLLSAALAAGPALAGEPPSEGPQTKPSASGEAVRMFRDPVTGDLRPATDEELAAIRSARGNAKREPLVVKYHGGRMVSAVVGERALEDLVAHRDPVSGKLVIEHRAKSQAPAPQLGKREEQ